MRIAIYEERDHNFVCFERAILWSSYPRLAISWYEAWKQFHPQVPVSTSQHPLHVVQEWNKGPVWLKAQPYLTDKSYLPAGEISWLPGRSKANPALIVPPVYLTGPRWCKNRLSWQNMLIYQRWVNSGLALGSLWCLHWESWGTESVGLPCTYTQPKPNPECNNWQNMLAGADFAEVK